MVKSSVTITLVPQIKDGPWIYQSPLEISIPRAAELGFDGVELFTVSGNSVDSDVLTRLLETYNIKLSAVGTGAGKVVNGLTLTDPNPEVREEAVSFITEMIKFGARFNAPAIIGSMQGNVNPGTDKEKSISWLIDGLSILGDVAEQLEVKLFFEPLNRYETNLINSLEEGVELIKSLKTQNIALLADLFHMNIEEKSIPETIMNCGQNIGYVHFADSNRRPIGMGHLLMNEIADVLKKIGYQGYISAEALPWPDPDTAAKQTIRSFKKYFGC